MQPFHEPIYQDVIISTKAATIMIGIVKQRKKVVPKLGEYHLSHSSAAYLQESESNQ